MTRFQQRLFRASTELGVRIELDFRHTLESGQELTVPIRFPDLGAPNGMLIVTSYEDIQPFVRELVRAGFGYSTLSEPGDDEVFDLESIEAMFADWGFSSESTT